MFESEPFGQRAVRLGLATSEQVREALETQKLLAEKAGLLGEILVEMGWLDPMRYIETVEEVSSMEGQNAHGGVQEHFIEALLRRNYIASHDIENARKIQADRIRKNKLIGQIMVEMGILDPSDRDRVLTTYRDNGKSI